MMTIEEYIVGKSVLPANGSHTMLEHIKNMALATYGECVEVAVMPEEVVDIVLEAEDIELTSTQSDISVEVAIDDVGYEVSSEDVNIIIEVIDE